jgi:hypothetical protein
MVCQENDYTPKTKFGGIPITGITMSIRLSADANFPEFIFSTAEQILFKFYTFFFHM